jgi:hypothetical protein
MATRQRAGHVMSETSSVNSPDPDTQALSAPAPNEPLQLTPGMRDRLERAVHALLDDPRLADACDLVRLTAVVLLAKAPAGSSRVVMRSQDQAGWLGCSISHVAHTVIPRARKTGAMTCAPVRDPLSKRVTAVEHDLLPLREARKTASSHPLAALTRRDLATLLRLCEAVTCPGWEPKDAPTTPAGYMASRQGRAAATDRLAAVLLVLRSRGDGRVRLAPGRVAAGYGRAEATVAQLLGCDITAGAVVMRRLLAAGAVALESPGSSGRVQLRLPQVLAAHERARAAAGHRVLSEPSVREAVEEQEQEQEEEVAASECPRCGTAAGEVADTAGGLALSGDGWVQESLEEMLTGGPESASRGQGAEDAGFPQVKQDPDPRGNTAAGAELHTTHPPVVEDSGHVGEVGGFSGSAVPGQDRLRERASAPEDQPGGQKPNRASAERGPLRGDKPDNIATFTRSSCTPVSEEQAVLAPAAALWARLESRPGGRWRVLKALRQELAHAAQSTGPDGAVRALAARLTCRLREQGGPGSVADPVGWLIRRGLPQRPGCGDFRCDDGLRLDTSDPCPGCDELVADRRAHRRRVAARLRSRLPAASESVWRSAYEQQLRTEVTAELAESQARREHAAAQDAEQQAAAARRRVEDEAAARARQAQACAGCSRPDSAGWCQACDDWASVQETIRRAGITAAAWPEDPPSRVEIDAVLAQTSASIREEIEEDLAALRVQGATRVVQARQARLIAELAASEYRRAALSALARTRTAEAEAEQAHEAGMRSAYRHSSHAAARAAADEAAERARQRVAEHLLSTGITQVHEALQDTPVTGGTVSDGYLRARAALAAAVTTRTQRAGPCTRSSAAS